MKRILAMAILWTSAWAVFAQAPTPAPAPAQAQKVTPKAPYESTKAQLYAEKEKNLQLQASQMTGSYQSQMKDLQDKFVGLDKTLNEWMAEVRKANEWDDTYTWDRDKDEWTHVPKPPIPQAPATAPPATAPAAEKK